MLAWLPALSLGSTACSPFKGKLPTPLPHLQALVAGGSAIAVARWQLGKATQQGGAAAVSPLLRSVLRLGGSSAQQQLPMRVSLPVRLAAVFVSS